MDFLDQDERKGNNYHLRLKNSIIFSKVLNANYKLQTVELSNFPIEEQVLVKEFTETYTLTKDLFETLKYTVIPRFF